jgi:hypothetical protein
VTPSHSTAISAPPASTSCARRAHHPRKRSCFRILPVRRTGRTGGGAAGGGGRGAGGSGPWSVVLSCSSHASWSSEILVRGHYKPPRSRRVPGQGTGGSRPGHDCRDLAVARP